MSRLADIIKSKNAVKTDVTEEINSQYIGDNDNSMHQIHNDAVEKKIHNQGYTYAKSFSDTDSRKLVNKSQRDISGKGWDIVSYRVIKIEKGRQRDFSGSNRIHKIKGTIDIQNEKK